jgi:hypothetical protein
VKHEDVDAESINASRRTFNSARVKGKRECGKPRNCGMPKNRNWLTLLRLVPKGGLHGRHRLASTAHSGALL